MKLNEQEEGLFDLILRGEMKNSYEENVELYEKVEFGLHISRVSSLNLVFPDVLLVRVGPILRRREASDGLVIFSGSGEVIRELVDLWLNGDLIELAVRIERSWRCYLRCNGKILERTCEEDKASTTKCCEHLRNEC